LTDARETTMKIDFYVLDDAIGGQKSFYFACQLIEQLLADTPQAIRVQMHSKEEAERFDGLLWTYRDDSFIPHALDVPAHGGLPFVHIAYGDHVEGLALQQAQDILMNLSPHVPAFYTQFKHIIEIVFPGEDMQQLARQRYKHYRDHGHEISTIKLKATEI
jgi:DNA polymerase-3 subunit chi